jgi:phospholipid-translocating ATPase
MIFKKLAMEYAMFDLENIDELKTQLDYNCENAGIGPMSDSDSNSSGNLNSKKKKGNRRETDYLVRDFMTALALCHNVTPTYPD